MPTNSPKWGLETVLGTDVINQLDDSWAVLTGQLDSIMVVQSSGPLSSRPVSTIGTPGKVGRFYRATDTGQLFYDTGTGWEEIIRRGDESLNNMQPFQVVNYLIKT